MRTIQQQREAVIALAAAVGSLAEEVRLLIDTLDHLRDDLKGLRDAITEDHWKPVPFPSQGE